MTPKIFFPPKSNMGIKNAENCADFKIAYKALKECLKKKLYLNNCTNFEFFTIHAFFKLLLYLTFLW